MTKFLIISLKFENEPINFAKSKLEKSAWTSSEGCVVVLLSKRNERTVER